MSKSCMEGRFFIQDGEKPVILITEHEYRKKERSDADNIFDCMNADITIERPNLQFSISLPIDALRELVEKGQNFLAVEAVKFFREAKEAQKEAESKETLIHK